MSAWDRICGAAVIRRLFARGRTKETMHRSLTAASLIALVAGVISGCMAASSTVWRQLPVEAGLPSIGSVFVIEPIVDGIGPPGNVGRDLPSVRRNVLARILAIVREHFPTAGIAEPGPYAVP